MASIIKTSQPPSTSTKGVSDKTQPSFFNATDLRQNAESELVSAKQQAEQLLEQAQRDAEEIRSLAREEGLAVAREEWNERVNAEAHRVAEEHCQSLLASCEKTMQRLQEETRMWLEQWQRQTTTLACRMAEKILRQPIQDRQQAILHRWLEESCQLANEARSISVHVHPGDFRVAKAALEQITREVPLASSTNVIEDDTVEPGGCQVITDQGILDYQISTQLKRLVEQLR